MKISVTLDHIAQMSEMVHYIISNETVLIKQFMQMTESLVRRSGGQSLLKPKHFQLLDI